MLRLSQVSIEIGEFILSLRWASAWWRLRDAALLRHSVEHIAQHVEESVGIALGAGDPSADLEHVVVPSTHWRAGARAASVGDLRGVGHELGVDERRVFADISEAGFDSSRDSSLEL